MKAPPKRPYRMQARAQAAAATGERILDAAVAVFWQRPVDDIPLEEVARRAGVSVQTVIRRFGGKQGLFAAAAERETERVRRQRDQAPVGDLPGGAQPGDHYEELGVPVLRLLGPGGPLAGAARPRRPGTRLPRGLVRAGVRPRPDRARGAQRGRRLAQLIAVTDVLTWKLLRRDRRLSRRQTELALIELLQPLTGGG